MQPLSIAHPIVAVLGGRTLVELCQYLWMYHEEHAVTPLPLTAVQQLLAGCSPNAAADAICNAGVRACYGAWMAYLAVAAPDNPEQLTPDTLLELIRTATQPDERRIGITQRFASARRCPRQTSQLRTCAAANNACLACAWLRTSRDWSSFMRLPMSGAHAAIASASRRPAPLRQMSTAGGFARLSSPCGISPAKMALAAWFASAVSPWQLRCRAYLTMRKF